MFLGPSLAIPFKMDQQQLIEMEQAGEQLALDGKRVMALVLALSRK